MGSLNVLSALGSHDQVIDILYLNYSVCLQFVWHNCKHKTSFCTLFAPLKLLICKEAEVNYQQYLIGSRPLTGMNLHYLFHMLETSVRVHYQYISCCECETSVVVRAYTGFWGIKPCSIDSWIMTHGFLISCCSHWWSTWLNVLLRKWIRSGLK